ncbi:hypothetical protein K443DRAFT_272430 [Laccaria amethystina LaAM-08-1]|uniref:Uncharacterized protein n=1 Tax=Laccaria amethystina LaAM-08-1 TaxID=1095629 RepID=A0A0C9WW33_9AGAR|nr:hypothetical protein K443DRAFT_272430 [Laccaria amethystina LaAM-08-1]
MFRPLSTHGFRLLLSDSSRCTIDSMYPEKGGLLPTHCSVVEYSGYSQISGIRSSISSRKYKNTLLGSLLHSSSFSKITLWLH